MTRAFTALCFVVLAVATNAQAEKLPDVVKFNRDIRPILSGTCFACHGPSEKAREGELRLDIAKLAHAKREDMPAITAGDLSKSSVWQRIITDDVDERMPPEDTKVVLTDREKELVKRWIEQGGKYEDHWAFIAPSKPAMPEVKQQAWATNPIDTLTLARMEKEGLKPSPEADRATLIRRITFDLTGLPPTPAEVDAFINDKSPNAYEKVVDRLFTSKHYGERMTLAWMDAARYGDSSVFHADGPRDMWGWRDWTIRAYNSNKRFDDFTIEQMAGDLIPDATVDQKVATGFYRNHGTTDEGGAIAEEYRVEYIVDRVKTTGNVWLGLTVECGQCHEHKFDPISQKEYYKLYAFFNSASDAGMQSRRGNAKPTVNVPMAGNDKAEAQQQLDDAKKNLETHVAGIEPAFQEWLTKASATVGEVLELPSDLAAHFNLDETKGNQVANAVDAKHKGNVKGKSLWAAGKIGGAFKCDGGNYVDLGAAGDFDNTQAFSYGAWIKPDKGASGAPIARMNDKNDFRGYDLWIQNGSPGVHIINKWPTNALKVVADKKLDVNKWNHVFVTYDGSNKAGGVKIYVNGKNEPWKIEQDSLSSTIRTKVPLYIGRRSSTSPFKGLVDDVRLYPRKLAEIEVAALAGGDPLKPLLALPADKRTPPQNKTLNTHYLTTLDKQYTTLQGEVTKLTAALAAKSKPLTTVMILEDLGKPRMTYVLQRGQYNMPIKEEEILPDTPAFLPPMMEGAPKNRLGLAQWLMDPKHPLTSRVAINRYWQILFGEGFVRTAGDFGNQGSWPSHPQLLDYLAVDFVESGWDVKRMLKQIVMSNTYRQTSRQTADLREKDPQNRLLARGPRFRLQGEFVRDNALALSGLMVPTIGGPSVRPYQPPGLWQEVALGGARFVQDHGEKLYRRSMYIYWKRSAPAPAMRIFDAPTREKCVIKRQRTNTPLQALVLMNDPQFVEVARVLAQRTMLEGGKTSEERVRFAYKVATAREPSPLALSILSKRFDNELKTFEQDAEQAKKLLAVGEAKRDESLSITEHAAWTIVTSIILNLDATITRG